MMWIKALWYHKIIFIESRVLGPLLYITHDPPVDCNFTTATFTYTALFDDGSSGHELTTNLQKAVDKLVNW